MLLINNQMPFCTKKHLTIITTSYAQEMNAVPSQQHINKTQLLITDCTDAIISHLRISANFNNT